MLLCKLAYTGGIEAQWLCLEMRDIFLLLVPKTIPHFETAPVNVHGKQGHPDVVG